MSDAPDQGDPTLAGGKREGGPGMEDATPWGGKGTHTPKQFSVAVGEQPGH